VFAIGYNYRYTDAKNGITPAYACVGHSEIWCTGDNDGFRAGNRDNNVYYEQSDQRANLYITGDNNKTSINQQGNTLEGGNEFASRHKSALPNCLISCLNSDVRVK
jgi:hypothetical protein